MSQIFLTLALIIIFFHYLSSSPSSATSLTYNVQAFGAKNNGKSDCTKAFLSTWASACATSEPATIYIPKGRYALKSSVRFLGQSCKNTAITMRVDGTLVAPSDYNALGNSGRWISFEQVNGVSIYGGTLDGQGKSFWACRKSGSNCPQGATSLAFYNSKNIIINGLSSLNSKMFHVLIYGCQNARLVNTVITAPGNSPNTDGIHVEQSTGVTIMSSRIGTGDDCISIGPGSSNLWIENLSCGPGHGISIGSLGWDLNEAGVQNVTVKSATITGTQNGVRVKTWARPSNGFVKSVLFQHIVMVNVQNPIIIDQNYCPDSRNCPKQVSGVKISDVTYQDINGTSATKLAVNLECSKNNPCYGITLDQINLTYGDQPATASCDNVGGVQPQRCL